MNTFKTHLCYRNETQNRIYDDIIFFQKNDVFYKQSIQESVVWRLISNCAYQCSHPFEFDHSLELRVADPFGNIVVNSKIEAGNLYSFSGSSSDNPFQIKGKTHNPNIIEIQNDLDSGTIDIYIHRNKNLLLKRTAVCPKEVIPISPNPILWVAKTYGFEKGDLISKDILKQCSSSVSLLGVVQADIVLRGGGFGVTAEAYSLSLENIVYT